MRLSPSLAAALFAVFAAVSVASAEDVDPENALAMDLSYGRVIIRLRPDLAPKHVAQIKTLVHRGFYDGLEFFRVIDGFMAQTGDPTNTGSTNSDLPNIPHEFTQTPFVRGVVGAARTDDDLDSANSQFFIMFDDGPWLDGGYTIWGEVVSGMEFVDRLHRGEPPENPDEIIRIQIAAEAMGK